MLPSTRLPHNPAIFALTAALTDPRQIAACIRSDRYVYSSAKTAERVGGAGVLNFLGIFALGH